MRPEPAVAADRLSDCTIPGSIAIAVWSGSDVWLNSERSTAGNIYPRAPSECCA